MEAVKTANHRLTASEQERLLVIRGVVEGSQLSVDEAGDVVETCLPTAQERRLIERYLAEGRLVEAEDLLDLKEFVGARST
jgi:hypothetical protein